MSQLKFYKYSIWALLLLNVGVLAFFFLTKPHPPHHASPNNFQSEVVEILGLNNQQAANFKKLAEDHMHKTRSINEQQEKLLPPYFKSLTDLSKNIDKDRILDEFQQLERKKIEVTYQHFQDIKSILDENQLPQFEGFMNTFIERILTQGKGLVPQRGQ